MSAPIVFDDYMGGGPNSGEGAVFLGALRAQAADFPLYGTTWFRQLTVYSPGVITRAALVNVSLRTEARALQNGNKALLTLPVPWIYANTVSLVPTVALLAVTAPILTVHATGVISRTGSVDAQLFGLRSRALENTDGVFARMMGVLAYAPELPPQRFISVVQSSGVLHAGVTGPLILAYVEDSLETADGGDTHYILQAIERVLELTSTGTSLVGLSSVVEHISATDFSALVFQLIAADDVTIAADPQAYLNNLLAVADAVFATGAVGTNFTNALVYVALVAELGDRADPVIFLSVEDTLAALDEAALQRVTLLVAAMDSFLVAATPDATLRLTVIAEDNAVFADDTGTSLQGLMDALDAGVFAGRLSVGGTSYSVYAMTLLGQAPSEYTNYEFDSYATIGGRLYAVGPQGLVLCEGGDDAGAHINASIRRGLSVLGTQLKKEVPYAYIGYTSTGSLVLETVTTDKKTKRVNRYKLSAIATPSFSDGRFKIAKGLHSVYWDFTLKNLDGADFEVDYVKVWRVPLSRRK